MRRKELAPNKYEDFIDFIQDGRDGLAAGLDDVPPGFSDNQTRKIGKCVDLLDAFLDSVRPNR